MSQTHSVAQIITETPSITEPYSAKVSAGCACGTKLIVTITRSSSGLVSPSVDMTCPDCKHDHSRLLGPVATMLDVMRDAHQRLAILN